MILYNASYPRSGNSWLIQLMMYRFHHLCSDIHSMGVTSEDALKHLEANSFTESFRFAGLDTLEFGLLCARYQSIGSPNVERLLLVGPSGTRLEKAGVREYLAEREETFVIKTHQPPYDHYFEGERVVQPVRHPGASLWSYHHFLQDVDKHPCALEEVIQGSVGFGSWSKYHSAWDPVALRLGNKMIRIKYEELFGAELAATQAVSTLSGLPIIADKSVPFSELHKYYPLLLRCGKPDEWRKHFNDAQMALLNQHHSEQMQRMGYAE